MEIDLAGRGAGVTSGESGSGPSAAAARRRSPGRWRRIPRAIHRSEKVEMARLPELDPTGRRLQETTEVDQKKIRLPSFRFEIVSDQKNPQPTLTSVLVEDQTKITSTLSAERYDPGLLLLQQERRPAILEVDMQVVVKGSRECEERSRQTMLEQAKGLFGTCKLH